MQYIHLQFPLWYQSYAVLHLIDLQFWIYLFTFAKCLICLNNSIYRCLNALIKSKQVAVLRTWIHCPCPTSSWPKRSTRLVGYWCSWAFVWPQWAFLCSLCRRQPSRRLQWRHLACLPRTRDPGLDAPTRRMLLPSSRTSPFCNSHWLSGSEDWGTHSRSPCLCRSPRLDAAWSS